MVDVSAKTLLVNMSGYNAMYDIVVRVSVFLTTIPMQAKIQLKLNAYSMTSANASRNPAMPNEIPKTAIGCLHPYISGKFYLYAPCAKPFIIWKT